MTPVLDLASTGSRITSKITFMDVVKLGIIVFGLIAGWFRMESRIDTLSIGQSNDKERTNRIESEMKSNREETREQFREINAKLDRLIEGGRK